MKILYKCSCLKSDREITVPERVVGTDVIEWMGCIEQCLSYDHRNNSPHCFATKMTYVKIPIAEDTTELGATPKKN